MRPLLKTFALAVLAGLAGCADDIEVVDPVALAQDQRIELDGIPYVLPRVAGGPERRGGDLAAPMRSRVDTVRVRIAVYGSTGERLTSRDICPRLTRRWSRSICESAYAPVYQALPRTFTLLDPAALAALRRAAATRRGGDEAVLVSALRFSAGRIDRACRALAPSARYCLSGRALRSGLLAFWESDPDDDDRISEMVQSFVDHAIGQREDFRTLERDAVRLRRTHAPCFGGNPYDDRSMERVRRYPGIARCRSAGSDIMRARLRPVG